MKDSRGWYYGTESSQSSNDDEDEDEDSITLIVVPNLTPLKIYFRKYPCLGEFIKPTSSHKAHYTPPPTSLIQRSSSPLTSLKHPPNKKILQTPP
jgi:hypothetical protein